MSQHARDHLIAALTEAVQADVDAHIAWSDTKGRLAAAQHDENNAADAATITTRQVEAVMAQLRRLALDEREDHAALAVEGLLPERQTA